MKTYLVIETVYYESTTVLKAFFNKQKAIDCMTTYAEKDNSKMLPNDNYRYKLSKDGLRWETPLEEYEVQEIEIE